MAAVPVKASPEQLGLAALKRRTVQNGVATNDLVLSAYSASNDVVFPKILDRT